MIEHLPILAQAVEPVSGLYELLLKNGVLGGAVGVLVWFLIKRDGDLQKCQEGRLQDAKALAEVVKEQTATLQATSRANEDRNRLLENTSKIAEKSALIVDQLTKEVADLQVEIRKLSGGK